MGGANAASGTALHAASLAGSILLDCAGETPPLLREAAGRCISFVFPDLEAVPQRYPRLLTLTEELARLLGGQAPVEADALILDGARVGRIYVLCQQGMNRSALVCGLTLRAAGFGGAEALAMLRTRRPGCLTNQTYAALISGALDGAVESSR